MEPRNPGVPVMPVTPRQTESPGSPARVRASARAVPACIWPQRRLDRNRKRALRRKLAALAERAEGLSGRIVGAGRWMCHRRRCGWEGAVSACKWPSNGPIALAILNGRNLSGGITPKTLVRRNPGRPTIDSISFSVAKCLKAVLAPDA